MVPVPLQNLTREEFQGKTYSLRTHEPDSDVFYRTIAEFADRLLQQHPDSHQLLTRIQRLSRSKRHLRRLVRDGSDSHDSALVAILKDELAGFTANVQSHLQGLRLIDWWDRTLATSEEQYHLYMLEIELTNRLYSDRFRSSSRKFAFLPHCLRDFSADCRADQRDIDYVCRGCTDDCNVNHTSNVLRLHGVKPYIWMSADLRGLLRKAKKERDGLGVLGIACIPELVRGMRMCLKYDVPVVGVPLDANRCARWWGEFYPNTVNMNKLESLLTGEH
jgi:hypothetical protein